ncbi:MAG: hypothetical protein JXB32_16365 [Deltaproteobacteria bacterium]|nr:hypothetical protein [Deltaproteobacteria bacterium]
MTKSAVRLTSVLVWLGAAGCGERSVRPAAPEPAGDADGPSPADVAEAPPPGDAERHWVVYVDELRLMEISDTPGILVDGNAPPPPPGVEPGRHPFLTAACGGDPLLCSRAGTLLRESTTLPEFLEKLRAEGWRVEETTVPAPGGASSASGDATAIPAPEAAACVQAHAGIDLRVFPVGTSTETTDLYVRGEVDKLRRLVPEGVTADFFVMPGITSITAVFWAPTPETAAEACRATLDAWLSTTPLQAGSREPGGRAGPCEPCTEEYEQRRPAPAR